MALHDELVALSQRLQCNAVLPMPPLCRQILERARAEGIPVGQVYIVCHPLQPGIQGSYDRQTHEMWCHYDGSLGEEGQSALVQSLLSMLASLQHDFPLPRSIEEDWEQMRRAHEGGFVLAHAWGLDAQFSALDAERLQLRDRFHLRAHLAAGHLAGHPGPDVARKAYFALLALREEQGWSEEMFEAILHGTAPDPLANAQAPLFDRSYLRQRWSTHSARKSLHFGAADITGEPVGACLRELVARVFTQRLLHEPLPPPFLVQAGGSHWFLPLRGETDLATLITLLNAWLIDAHPEAAVRLSCFCYADAPQVGRLTPRLYRGDVGYEGQERFTLWVLCAGTPATRLVEAAWQALLRSWLTFGDLHQAPLSEGIQALWRLFQE